MLLVWRLDRLGRSARHLVDLVETLQNRGVGFRSICDGAIDTTSASGKLVFTIYSMLAQFERRLISERTKAGLAAARARGRLGGCCKIEANDPKVLIAKALHRDRSMEIVDFCTTLNISRATLSRYLGLNNPFSIENGLYSQPSTSCSILRERCFQCGRLTSIIGKVCFRKSLSRSENGDRG